MHPAALLFQPRVKNAPGRAAFSAESQKRLIYYNDPGRQWRISPIVFEHISPALAFPHQIAATDVTIPLSSGLVWPHVFQKFGLERSGEKPIFTMFNVR